MPATLKQDTTGRLTVIQKSGRQKHYPSAAALIRALKRVGAEAAHVSPTGTRLYVQWPGNDAPTEYKIDAGVLDITLVWDMEG